MQKVLRPLGQLQGHFRLPLAPSPYMQTSWLALSLGGTAASNATHIKMLLCGAVLGVSRMHRHRDAISLWMPYA